MTCESHGIRITLWCPLSGGQRRLCRGLRCAGDAINAEEIEVSIRVGVNGFGRIGRNFYRALAAQKAEGKSTDIEVIASMT